MRVINSLKRIHGTSTWSAGERGEGGKGGDLFWKMSSAVDCNRLPDFSRLIPLHYDI